MKFLDKENIKVSTLFDGYLISIYNIEIACISKSIEETFLYPVDDHSYVDGERIDKFKDAKKVESFYQSIDEAYVSNLDEEKVKQDIINIATEIIEIYQDLGIEELYNIMTSIKKDQ